MFWLSIWRYAVIEDETISRQTTTQWAPCFCLRTEIAKELRAYIYLVKCIGTRTYRHISFEWVNEMFGNFVNKVWVFEGVEHLKNRKEENNKILFTAKVSVSCSVFNHREAGLVTLGRDRNTSEHNICYLQQSWGEV